MMLVWGEFSPHSLYSQGMGYLCEKSKEKAGRFCADADDGVIGSCGDFPAVLADIHLDEK